MMFDWNFSGITCSVNITNSRFTDISAGNSTSYTTVSGVICVDNSSAVRITYSLFQNIVSALNGDVLYISSASSIQFLLTSCPFNICKANVFLFSFLSFFFY
jgi:short-subunit dehydrogenase